MSAKDSDASPIRTVSRASDASVLCVPRRVLALGLSHHSGFASHRTSPIFGRPITVPGSSDCSSNCSHRRRSTQRYSSTVRHGRCRSLPFRLSHLERVPDAARKSQMTATPNKTDAGNGSYGICRFSNVLRSPSPDPRRSPSQQHHSPYLPMRVLLIALMIHIRSAISRGGCNQYDG